MATKRKTKKQLLREHVMYEFTVWCGTCKGEQYTWTGKGEGTRGKYYCRKCAQSMHDKVTRRMSLDEAKQAINGGSKDEAIDEG